MSPAVHDSNDGPTPSWTKWNDLYVDDPTRLYYEVLDWLQEHQDYNEITAMMETLASYADAMGGAGAAYEFQNVYANAYATGQLADAWGGKIYGGDPRLGYLAAGIITRAGIGTDNIVSLNGQSDCSFSADTLVATNEGPEPISTIQVGDKVLAWNQATGETGYYTVTVTHSHLDPVLVYLTIDGETILTTPEHPFYTVAGAWVGAGHLQVGSRVYATDGQLGAVEAVKIVPQAEVMYNLTVDQAHTFAVGEGQWLVHNQCRFNPRNLQHEFEHAADFGVTGNWNRANAQHFQEAIQNHISNAPQQIAGTFRNSMQVTHYFDPATNLWAAVDNSGTFVAGWRLYPSQVVDLVTNGNVR